MLKRKNKGRRLREIFTSARAPPTVEAVVKATDSSPGLPKEKHVQDLIDYTGLDGLDLGHICNKLLSRAHKPSVVISLKALLVAHRMLRVGSSRFSQVMATRSYHYRLDGFVDSKRPMGNRLSGFVRLYARYLNERMACYRHFGDDVCTPSGRSCVEDLDLLPFTELCDQLRALQAPLDALLATVTDNINLSVDGTTDAATSQPVTSDLLLNQPVIKAAITELHKDCVLLFQYVNTGGAALLTQYFALPKQQAKEALTVYSAFVDECRMMERFLEFCGNVGLSKAHLGGPALSKTPSTMLSSMAHHVSQYNDSSRRQSAASISSPQKRPSSGSVSLKELEEYESQATPYRPLPKARGAEGPRPTPAQAPPPSWGAEPAALPAAAGGWLEEDSGF